MFARFLFLARRGVGIGAAPAADGSRVRRRVHVTSHQAVPRPRSTRPSRALLVALALASPLAACARDASSPPLAVAERPAGTYSGLAADGATLRLVLPDDATGTVPVRGTRVNADGSRVALAGTAMIADDRVSFELAPLHASPEASFGVSGRFAHDGSAITLAGDAGTTLRRE